MFPHDTKGHLNRLLAFLLTLLLMACGKPATPAVPFYTSAPCTFHVPQGTVVHCGQLTTWEDHQHPSGRTIQLYVAVFKSQSQHPAPDPVVYLVGGPGGYYLVDIQYLFNQLVKPFLSSRDFILFDQRGTGFSKPALECPDIPLLSSWNYDGNPQVLACRDRLLKQGINLAAYRSAQSAADLNDLRQALGYTSWNLVGESYGTHLALITMRDVPQGVRSVILDATTRPPGSKQVDEPAQAFTTFFHGCAADDACNTAYPHLREVFEQTVARLNASPVTRSFEVFGHQQEVVLTGSKLTELVYYALYETPLIPELPRAIAAASDGSDYAFWGQVLQLEAFFNGHASVGAYISVACGDGSIALSVCGQWNSRPPDPIEDQPIHSPIPTLVLAGEYDPISLPVYGQAAARMLSHSSFLLFPGMGHTTIGYDPCPTDIALAFLDHPAIAPDAACIAHMHGPAFVVGRVGARS
jgi:pimeloyl-ACP methyl ester carboxylesterase